MGNLLSHNSSSSQVYLAEVLVPHREDFSVSMLATYFHQGPNHNNNSSLLGRLIRVASAHLLSLSSSQISHFSDSSLNKIKVVSLVVVAAVGSQALLKE